MIAGSLVFIAAGLPNTGDKLRSSIACAGFVCFIHLFDGAAPF
jgi:hypothetical protein